MEKTYYKIPKVIVGAVAVIVIGLVVALVVSIVDAMSSTGSRSDDIKYPTYNVIQESLIETASCSEFEAQMLVNWIQVAASNNKQEYDVYIEVNMSGSTNEELTRWTIDLYTPYDEISIGIYYNSSNHTWITYKLVWPNRAILDQWVSMAVSDGSMGRI